ncbi:sigma-70 family RNA polymerase sigma factor [Paradesertivirga mongoliensis]|uniref:Sigma-70 family RNA polymerase sigma factor n=1 Tax=Paradesertivirga mongoliensis TaxID=2100740 RepID=A0ABW4ZKD8_9SPHI|nr:sigma-70 family RNA polymerase sigma factor [Pedobacter mongoliensis]
MISSLHTQSLTHIEAHRPVLISYAYNILGSYQEAKDVVQDAYLQVITRDISHIENMRAYLTRTVINLSINQKNRQKKMRRSYPGEWLPEPVSTDHADETLRRKEVLSYSLMVLLEKLNARQRAVFILKEAFDYDHAEIGEIIGVTEENSRQLLRRAKRQLQDTGSQINQTFATEKLNSYLQAIQRAEIERLSELLREDIIVISDGGGKARAALNPVTGKAALSYLYGINTKFYINKPIYPGEVNHQPALFYFDEGVLTGCHVFTFENGLLKYVHIIRNPEKLIALQ